MNAQIGEVVVSHPHRCFQTSLGELFGWICHIVFCCCCDEYVKGEHVKHNMPLLPGFPLFGLVILHLSYFVLIIIINLT